MVPADLTARVAVYRDAAGLLMLLGPRGWRCRALDAADGSAGVVAYPASETIPGSWSAWWHSGPASPAEAVSGVETGGSSVQAAGQACAFFASAAAAFEADLGHGCTPRPSAETVTRLGAGVAGFEDPAGIRGAGIPSGGRYPANGVVTYSASASPGSYKGTCTLPASEHALCTAVLNEFLILDARH